MCGRVRSKGVPCIEGRACRRARPRFLNLYILLSTSIIYYFKMGIAANVFPLDRKRHTHHNARFSVGFNLGHMAAFASVVAKRVVTFESDPAAMSVLKKALTMVNPSIRVDAVIDCVANSEKLLYMCPSAEQGWGSSITTLSEYANN